MTIRLQPPPFDIAPLGSGGAFQLVWERFLLRIQNQINTGLVPVDAPLVIATADSDLTHATNLGLLASGYLKTTTTLGVAVPASTPTIPADDISGILTTPHGGTGVATLALNGLLYGNDAGAIQALAVNTTATKKFATQVSSAAPAWATIAAGDVPTLNQNTTGSAGSLSPGRTINGTLFDGTANITITPATAGAWTTARLLAGNSVDGSVNVPFANKFIVQGTTDTGLSAAQFLGALATGIVKNTVTTGVLSTAVAADFPTLNQNTTGSAAALTTPRTINGVAFDGTANITVTAAAGTLTGATLAAIVTASSLASVGTLTSGATGTGFTIALSTSTVTGTLADARLSANVPLLNAINSFTARQVLVPSAASTLGVNANAAAIVSMANQGVSQCGYLTFGVSGDTNAAAAFGFVYTSVAGEGKGDLVFATRNVTTDTAPTECGRFTAAGNFQITGFVKFGGTNTTGAGLAGLGANSPAATLTQPYTWIQAISADGSTVYIPCWK